MTEYQCKTTTIRITKDNRAVLRWIKTVSGKSFDDILDDMIDLYLRVGEP